MDTIKLWIENRLDNEIDKPYEEVANGFRTSSYFERYVFETFTTLRDMLLLYLASKDGENATFEPEDFESFYDYMRVEVKKWS